MSNAPKYISYNGVDFCRDDKTGYYLNSVIHERLHRYVWEHEAGPIPKGFEIHHIDRDKANNSIDNLCLMTAAAHRALHAKDERDKEKIAKALAAARPEAAKWHGSEEGRAWHSKHQKETVAKTAPRLYTCERCGKEFEALPFGFHKYCSNACRAAARRARGDDNETRVCPICGKGFVVNKYSKIKYCSLECAGKHRTQVNDAKRAAGIPVRRPGENNK